MQDVPRDQGATVPPDSARRLLHRGVAGCLLGLLHGAQLAGVAAWSGFVAGTEAHAILCADCRLLR